MLWTYNDSGYLIAVDMPETGRCHACGTVYRRRIADSRPWQADTPDACPSCGHIMNRVGGVAFDNAAC